MFDKNRVHFMNAYYKETEKPFGYLLVDNKPDTPADKQVLGDLFGDCRVCLFATQTKVNSTSVEPTPVETKSRRKQPKHQRHITWSDATIAEWQNFTKEAQVVRNIPEGYVITEMYKSSRNSFDRSHPGVYIGGENYWPVKIMNQSGRMKWVNLHEDEPTVRTFVKETMANEQLSQTTLTDSSDHILLYFVGF